MPIVSYPGVPLSDTSEEFHRKVRHVVAPAVVEALTNQPDGDTRDEAALRRDDRIATDIVFTGSLEEVHDYFLDRHWTDGLPIVPPTRDRVEAFLRHTDRDAAEVLGVLLPARREATVWNVAVNGVMAGCAPECMPLLAELLPNAALAEPPWDDTEWINSKPGRRFDNWPRLAPILHEWANTTLA